MSKWVVTLLLLLALTGVASAADPETNKKAVLGFYAAVGRFDFDAARPFIGPHYTQHSPKIEDGTEGLRKALNGFREEFKGLPLPKLDVKMLVAEGDYVAMLSHITFGSQPRSIAVADLFRLEDGKLVEHWDITEWLAAQPPGAGMFDSVDKPSK